MRFESSSSCYEFITLQASRQQHKVIGFQSLASGGPEHDLLQKQNLSLGHLD